MASIFSLRIYLNASVGSTGVLLIIEVEVFLGTAKGRTRVVIGSIPEGSETVELMSKGRESLDGAVPPPVGARTGLA